MSVFTLTDPDIQKLVAISRELKDLVAIVGLLSWDQETYLPAKGALARSHQLETLAGIYHDKITNPRLGELLLKLDSVINTKPDTFTLADKALVREMQRDHSLAIKLPKSLVQALSRETSLGLEAWQHARNQNDFRVFAPNLETIIKLKRETAEAYGYTDSPYDALLDEYEEGLTKQTALNVLEPLQTSLQQIIPTLVETTKVYDKGVLKQHYDSQKLWDLSMHLLTLIGFDLERGRQDTSAHPFTMGFHHTDVRLTTRILETNPISTLLSSIHEGGHGIYEQGISPDISETTLGYINSLVLHESQSRFFENMIGKSLGFWQYIFPKFQATFPEHLEHSTAESVWHELNVVRPSLIRVDADEVTYHMHIIIRTQLEIDLIEGRLAVKDIPEAWRAAYKKYLDIEVPDDAQGALQDMHWSQGLIGYFPTYSLGSLLATQLYEQMCTELPDILLDIRAGKFESPRKWLNSHVHQHGRMYSSEQIARSSTGQAINPQYFTTYLKRKFGI